MKSACLEHAKRKSEGFFDLASSLKPISYHSLVTV